MIKAPENNFRAVSVMFKKPKDFVFFIISTIIVALTEAFIILSVKNYIDTINFREDVVSLTVITFILLVITLVLFLIVRNVSKTNMALTVRSELIKEAQKSMLNANISDLCNSEIKSALNNIIFNSNRLSEYVRNSILSIIQKIISFIVFGIVSLITQPVLSLALFLCLPFYYIGLRTVDFALSKFDKKYEKLEKENTDKIDYLLDVIKDVKLKNGIALENEELDSLVDEETKVEVNRSFMRIVANTFVSIFFEGIVLAICFGLGGVLYRAGNYGVSSGTFFYFMFTVPILFSIVYKCMHMKIAPSNISKEAKELNLIMSLSSEIKSEPITNLDEIHSFKFKEVSLLCNGNYVLDNISFEIKRSEKIGILTSDKETKDALFDIITKVTKDHTGEVLINNCELNKIQTGYLRSIISSVSSNNIIFNKTILENIIYPEKFDDYKYNDALNRTGLKEIINALPEKGNTMLTKELENHNDIASRIIFANAFYHDSKIYLFNDATLNFDPLVEHQMFEEISKLKNKVVINITDKPYLLNNCDKIMIIEDGKEVEYGKYDELITNKGSKYYKMIKKPSVKKTKIS